MSGDQQVAHPGAARRRGFGVLLVALSVLAVIVSVAFIAEGVKGVQDHQLRNHSHAQRVTASIDRVVRSCHDRGAANGL